MSDSRRGVGAALVLMTAAVFLIAGPQGLMAAPARTITYQGVVADVGGVTASDGQYGMRFTLYDDPTAGTTRWLETRDGANAVTVARGAFSVDLGSVTPFPSGFFSQYGYLWLEIAIDIDADGLEFGEVYAPRVRLSMTPYAFQSDHADTADTANNATNAADADTLDGLDSTELAAASHAHSVSTVTNESGISTDFGGTDDIALTATDVVLASVTLSAPSSGYVVVIANALYDPSHVVGTKDYGRFTISKNSSISYDAMVNVTTPANAATDSDLTLPVSVHLVEAVAAGSHTYNFVADAYLGTPGVDRARITAMFFPTAYGTIDVSVAAEKAAAPAVAKGALQGDDPGTN